jgi:transglutaminase-like putative cysteine protease
MDYTVRHVTRFRYSAPVAESMMELRMQPRGEGAQRCLSFALTTEPRARPTATRDYLGNIVHHFGVPARHKELTITAQALVMVAPPPALPTALDPDAWDELQALVADSDAAEMLVPSHFARSTSLLRELARELRLRRRDDPLTLLREANTGVHQSFAYTPQSTNVHSSIDDALRRRQGVCQDFTHVMIALVRELGIPCRYVSGYLYRHSSQLGRDATHAWVEALLPRWGWVGFDPTNDTLAGERHIRTAIGRDYADVPPTRGVFKGRADTELSVAVQVVAAGEALGADELLPVSQGAPHESSGEQPEQQQQAHHYRTSEAA